MHSRLQSFRSIRERVKFFDSHDLGDYWDSLPEVDFEIEIRTRRNLFRIEDKVAKKLNQIARKRKIPSQVLIDTWLREKVSEGGT